MNQIGGRWPGVIASYDGVTRMCRVQIPGITDGSEDLPEATIEYPVGDRAGDTAARLLPGDTVWLAFEGGDPRFPIVTGHRTPRVGNQIDWRRWRHANMELTADDQMILNAKDLVINAETLTINAKTTINGDTETNGSLKNNGTNVGSTHRHDEMGDSAPVSPPY